MPGRSMIAISRPSARCAIPVCCSTVTPGKFATFWWSPVSLLNRVVLPQLGGPTKATVLGLLGDGSGGRTAALQPLHADTVTSALTVCSTAPQSPSAALFPSHPLEKRGDRHRVRYGLR